ncbi:MAG TPA: PilZ domain-containing protein [Terriglobales bacterium]|jgi:CheY-like chemotaxis protein|nr:PilZ domain-containing protein [Terriglobales bacterium]
MDLRVLVVCPDQDSAKLLSTVLAEMEIKAEHTPSISRGLERLHDEIFDAVILDYRADQSSEEFLGKLRQTHTRTRKTLLIAILDADFSARPVFGLGANFVLYRPLSLERTRLSLRAARGLMRRERRRGPRIPVNSPTSLAHPGAEDGRGTLLDLSDGGTLLRGGGNLPPAGKVYFQFALPGQPQPVRVSGEVAWQDAAGRTGIRFVDVPQASRRLMHAWLLQNSFRETKDKDAPPAAPLPPAGRQTTFEGNGVSLSSNRRGERRFACKLGAEVYRAGSNVPNRCTLSDVSEGGCYVEMPSPLNGQPAVEIVVRTAQMRLKIRGQVQAVHPGFGMGVRFTFDSADEREEVLQLLAQLSAGPTLDELHR